VIEAAARGAQFLLAIGIAYVVALWFAVVAWTFRDIEARSRSVFTQVFSTLLVVLFFVPGLLLYLILRPKETLDQAFQRALEEEYLLQDLDELPLCPGCQRAVDTEFILCPHCQTQLREPCPSCARLIDLRWSVCPYCAVPVDKTDQGAITGIDSIRVLEDARAGRRQRAVAAAAQRVGIGPDELDAFTDALAGSGGHAAVSASSGSSRWNTTLRDSSQLGSTVRSKLSQLLPQSSDVPTSGESGDMNGVANTTSAETTGSRSSFWADPLPGSGRPQEPGAGRDTPT
jgi:hypothetical protein